jgi:endonuclease YncB( thermonuclease family)
MMENGDPPRPAPRVDILRELAVVLVPVGGQDAQLEQIREMQARLDEGARTLGQFRRNIRQEWAD